MDQGAISTFKSYNMRKTFARAMVTTKKDTERTLMEFWKDYIFMTASETLLRLWVMLPRSAGSASERRH